MRKLGDITADLEDLILELTDEHDLQWGEIMAIVHNYLVVHCPQSREEYVDGGHPVYYYGPEGCKGVRSLEAEDEEV